MKREAFIDLLDLRDFMDYALSVQRRIIAAWFSLMVTFPAQ